MAIGPDDASRPQAVDRHIGRKVRARREELDISPEELAFMTGAAVAALRNIEAGNSRATPEQMVALSQALGVTIQWFFEDL